MHLRVEPDGSVTDITLDDAPAVLLSCAPAALGADLEAIVTSRVRSCRADTVARDATLAALPYTGLVGLHVTEAGVIDGVTLPPGPLGACVGPRLEAVTLTPADAPTTLAVQVTVRLSDGPLPGLDGSFPY